MKILKCCFVLFSIAFFLSCTKEEEPAPEAVNFYYGYAPIQLGKYWIYQVDSIVYNDFSIPVSIDTFRYFVKREISDAAVNLEGDEHFEVSRFFTIDTNTTWNLSKKYTVRKTAGELICKMDNLPIVSLIFPVANDEIWNANAYNTQEEKTFRYEDVHESATTEHFFFDSTAKVIKHQKTNLLEDEFAMEQYAYGVGMVLRQERYLKTDFRSEIKSGYKLNYQLIAY